MPYDPAIPLLGIHTKETRMERDTCTPMFITALFLIARTWKQLRCPSADEWKRKLWNITQPLKRYIWISSNEVDESGAYYTEWSKPERKTPIQYQFSSVQSLSRVQLFATPWIAPRQASLFITISQSSLRLTSIESVMPSSHLILGHPLLFLPPIPPSIGVFSNESTLSWGGQSTGVSALASFLPNKSQGWSPIEWTGWISLQSKGLSRVFSNTTAQKHQFFSAQPSSQSNSHIHTWLLEKP